MTERYRRETATIHFLADRVRFGAGQGIKRTAEAKNLDVQTPRMVFGEGWYHDAAIRETDPSRKV